MTDGLLAEVCVQGDDGEPLLERPLRAQQPFRSEEKKNYAQILTPGLHFNTNLISISEIYYIIIYIIHMYLYTTIIYTYISFNAKYQQRFDIQIFLSIY